MRLVSGGTSCANGGQIRGSAGSGPILLLSFYLAEWLSGLALAGGWLGSGWRLAWRLKSRGMQGVGVARWDGYECGWARGLGMREVWVEDVGASRGISSTFSSVLVEVKLRECSSSSPAGTWLSEAV